MLFNTHTRIGAITQAKSLQNILLYCQTEQDWFVTYYSCPACARVCNQSLRMKFEHSSFPNWHVTSRSPITKAVSTYTLCKKVIKVGHGSSRGSELINFSLGDAPFAPIQDPRCCIVSRCRAPHRLLHRRARPRGSFVSRGASRVFPTNSQLSLLRPAGVQIFALRAQATERRARARVSIMKGTSDKNRCACVCVQVVACTCTWCGTRASSRCWNISRGRSACARTDV